MNENNFDHTLKRFQKMEKAKQEKLIRLKAENAAKTASENRPFASPKPSMPSRVPLAERTQQILEEKEQRVALKKKNIEIEKITRELDQCTFKPSLNAKTNSSHKKNSENNHPTTSRIDVLFKWADDKNRRIANIALEQDIGNAMPLLNSAQGSGIKRKANHKTIEKSIERLYNHHIVLEKKKLELQVKEAETLKFKPEINKKSLILAEKRKQQAQVATHIQAQQEKDCETKFSEDAEDLNVHYEESMYMVELIDLHLPKDKKNSKVIQQTDCDNIIPKKGQKLRFEAEQSELKEMNTSNRKIKKRKNVFEADAADLIELERTIDKAQSLFHMDRRRSKEKVKLNNERTQPAEPEPSADLVSKIKDLCADIDCLAVSKEISSI